MRSYLSVILAVALLVFGLACSSDTEETRTEEAGVEMAAEKKPVMEERTAKVGEMAPNFVLTDTEGKKHALEDFEGRYVILEWINFDCPFVQKHYKSGNMQELQETYKDQKVVWLTICSSAPGKQGYFEGEALKSRMEKEKWNGTAYLIDESGKVGKMYQAKTTPHMYIINPEGMLIYAGAIDDKPSANVDDITESTNYVKQAMSASMAGEEVPVKTTVAYGCSVKYQ